jgi:predicted nuclease of predicted toxin-antitoxin system
VALLKLDENLPDVTGDVLRTAGHDVALARDEGLAGAVDDALLATAVSEGRALVTMDLDFSDVRRHPPGDASGIIVLRLRDQTLPAVRRAMSRLAGLLAREPLQGHLWIVDESRLRIWPGTSDVR